MRILSRVLKLERRRAEAAEAIAVAQRTAPCAVCGVGPEQCDRSNASPRTWRVSWTFDVGNDDHGPATDTPTHCPGCGRQRVFVMSFDQDG